MRTRISILLARLDLSLSALFGNRFSINESGLKLFRIIDNAESWEQYSQERDNFNNSLAGCVVEDQDGRTS